MVLSSTVKGFNQERKENEMKGRTVFSDLREQSFAVKLIWALLVVISLAACVIMFMDIVPLCVPLAMIVFCQIINIFFLRNRINGECKKESK